MKRAKIIVALLLACSGTFASPPPAEISAQIATFKTQMGAYVFMDSMKHESFKYFVDYIKAVYPNASTEKYNSTAAILTNALYSGRCPGILDNFDSTESGLDTVKMKMLALLSYHWQNMVLKYPNRDNVFIEVAAILTASSMSHYCDWLTPVPDTTTVPPDTIPTPYVYGTNDTLTIPQDTALVLIDILDNDTLVNITLPDTNFVAYFYTLPANGTASFDSLNRIIYTPDSGYVGNDTIRYYYQYAGDTIGMPVAYYSVYIVIRDTTTVPPEIVYTYFYSIRLNVCTEDAQGRLTWSLSFDTISGISDLQIDMAMLVIPMATPSSVTDITITGMDGMLTPSSFDQRSKLALPGESKQILLIISFIHNGNGYSATLSFDLPQILQSSNSCWDLTGTYSEN